MKNFSDFCEELLKSGFSMGGGDDKGIFAIVPYDWKNQADLDTPIKWHTGDPETDPWEWRMRVLEERSDIAYAKLFFKTSGYITKDWYSYFFSIRRGDIDFDTAYNEGKISHTEKIIYDIIRSNDTVALHEIKQLGNFSKEDNSKFDKAITDLQMKMFITVCGRVPKIGKDGKPYGWNSTVFSTVESFWNKRGIKLKNINTEDALKKIQKQILSLNPNADEKKIKKFICG